MTNYKIKLEKIKATSTSEHNHLIQNSELIRIKYNHSEEFINPLLLTEDEKILVFFELHVETKRLNEESKKVQQFLLLKDDEINNIKIESEDYSNNVIIKFSTVLETFFTLKFLLQKSIFVINNYIQQLNAISEIIPLNSSFPVSLKCTF